ncbi:ferritin family protein [Candidatus Woesearchaeota archaeon]|nr:ferritin family protein [Candidatus Woesearchaeota archaeon]
MNALQQAVEFEHRGYTIYRNTANKTKDGVTRRIFTYLAEQEQDHINRINNFAKTHQIVLDKKDFGEGDKLYTSTTTSFKKKAQKVTGDVETYELGMQLEKDSYEFYRQQHDKAPTDVLKKFFKFLLEQESEHYKLLEKGHRFIQNPAAFYSEQEDWFFEG